MDKLLTMLRWKRPSGNDLATKMFGEVFLEPVMGKPDEFGNYTHIIKGEVQPNLCFTAHYDTVHRDGGFQEIEVKNDTVTAVDSDCLGADCTTGIYLILEMIAAGIPGVYVIHADEEIGCRGSGAIVESEPVWLSLIDAVISFDRLGENSVVTHQMGQRTASDAFAKSFADALSMPKLRPDSGGVYTDSNEYANVVSECTNISVGYYCQHSSSESQDLVHLKELRDALIDADWSKLVFERDPSASSYDDEYIGRGWYRSDGPDDMRELWEKYDLKELLIEFPEEIAEYMYDCGITASELAQEAGVESSAYIDRYLERAV